MATALMGHTALWGLGRALGLPDELPGVRAIRLVVEVNRIVAVEVEMIPTPEQFAAVEKWVADNAAGIRVVPTVIETGPGEDCTGPENRFQKLRSA